jgi:2-(3-amino-3-carboxypropyl)histidine synthase
MLDPKNLISEIKKSGYKRLLLQVPEGLKTEITRIVREIEKETSAKVFIWAEPCYGACDLPIEAAKMLNVDAIIHLGHLDFGVKSEVPIIYFPIEYYLKIPPALKKEISGLKQKKIAVFSSVQFKKTLDELEVILKECGKTIIEKKIILGCSDIKTSAKVSLFIGSGKFHPKALKGIVYQIDLEKGNLVDLSSEIKREEMKRFARLEKLKTAKKVGILLSKKRGQFYPDFEKLKERLEKDGKSVEILIFDEITNDKLLGLDFDAYINTACPRILDNHFDRPVINLRDMNQQ